MCDQHRNMPFKSMIEDLEWFKDRRSIVANTSCSSLPLRKRYMCGTCALDVLRPGPDLPYRQEFAVWTSTAG